MIGFDFSAGKLEVSPVPRVVAVIINWNGLSDTLECLESLAQVSYPNLLVLVVDNGSQQDESEAIQKAFPAVTTLRTERNGGFTGGNNLGIDHALAFKPDYVLLLNNDTVVAENFLEHLVDALETNPGAGMAAAKIPRHNSAPDDIWYEGAEISFDEEALRLGCLAWHGSYPERATATQPFETPIATACALLVRSEVLRRIGGQNKQYFDDRFFAYYEDVDLNLRVDKLGLRRVVVPRALVWHKVSRSSGGELSPSVHYYTNRNAKMLILAHFPEDASRSREQFWEEFRQLRIKDAFQLACNGKQAIAQAILSAMWCAQGDHFGPRHDHNQIERRAAIALWLHTNLSPQRLLRRRRLPNYVMSRLWSFGPTASLMHHSKRLLRRERHTSPH